MPRHSPIRGILLAAGVTMLAAGATPNAVHLPHSGSTKTKDCSQRDRVRAVLTDTVVVPDNHPSANNRTCKS